MNTSQITYIKHEYLTKQMGVKTNRTSFYTEILEDMTCSRHDIAENLLIWR